MENYSRTRFIYALMDPRCRCIRYVGVSRKPRTRLVEHMAPCSASPPALLEWFSELSAKGLSPVLQILETLDGFWAAMEAEKRWIGNCSSPALTNRRDRGDFVHLITLHTQAGSLARSIRQREHRDRCELPFRLRSPALCVVVGNKQYTMAEWARMHGYSKQALHQRLRKMSPTKALTLEPKATVEATR